MPKCRRASFFARNWNRCRIESMIFLIPLLARAVLVGSGVVVAKSVYDRTKIEQERLELEKEKAKTAPTPPQAIPGVKDTKEA